MSTLLMEQPKLESPDPRLRADASSAWSSVLSVAIPRRRSSGLKVTVWTLYSNAYVYRIPPLSRCEQNGPVHSGSSLV